jgi:ribosomal protein S19
MLRRISINRTLKKIIFSKRLTISVEPMVSKNLKSYDKSLKNFFYPTTIIIPKRLVGHRIFFFTGKGISSIKVTSFMVGYRLGEFVNFRLSRYGVQTVKDLK